MTQLRSVIYSSIFENYSTFSVNISSLTAMKSSLSAIKSSLSAIKSSLPAIKSSFSPRYNYKLNLGRNIRLKKGMNRTLI